MVTCWVIIGNLVGIFQILVSIFQDIKNWDNYGISQILIKSYYFCKNPIKKRKKCRFNWKNIIFYFINHFFGKKKFKKNMKIGICQLNPKKWYPLFVFFLYVPTFGLMDLRIFNGPLTQDVGPRALCFLFCSNSLG